VARAIVCGECGSKFRADRERCPRCRAYVTRLDPNAAPAAIAASGRRLQRMAAAIMGAFVLLLAVLWLVRDHAPRQVNVPARPADLAAGPRSAEPPAPMPVAEGAAAAPPGRPPFLAAAGEGTLAYGAGDYEMALQRFQAAVEQNPDDAESLSNLGQVLVKLGRTAEAVPYFDRAVQILPTRWAYQFNLARAQGLLGNWDQAIATYRRAQELFPNDYATTFNLALALHKRGDETGAVEEYRKAVELNPDDPSFRLALATSQERLNNRAEAAAAYQEYLRLWPEGPDADKVKARIALLGGGGATPGKS
jgi:tetratricopeptide (TPR) repeat protein